MSSEELKDIEAYKHAVIEMKRLEYKPHVESWIESEGERLTEERVQRVFKSYMQRYNALTMDDYEWLKSGYNAHVVRRIVVVSADENNPTDVEIIRKEEETRTVTTTKKFIIDEITYFEMLPFEVSDYKGGGYHSLVQHSLKG